MRFRLPALFAGLALVAAGCTTEPTAPDDRAAANDAARELLHIADSLAANGGGANEVGTYRGLAALLQGTGRLSSVTISVDGAPGEFLATATEIVLGCPPGMACALIALPPDRFVSAWQKDNPRRMVQLFVPGYSFPTVAGDGDDLFFAAVPDLLFLDGDGALYGGPSTSRSVSSAVSDRPCARRDSAFPTTHPAFPCREADFTVAFDGVTTLIPLDDFYSISVGSSRTSSTTSSANAAPSHRVTMLQQLVHGAQVELTPLCIDYCPYSPGTTPPMTAPWRDSLSGSLTASVGSDVTFTFTVKNAGAGVAELKFSDSQQYDIRVWNERNELVWRWGADMAFAQALTSRTLAAGGTATWVAHWTPPSAGKYRAMAYLTSSSHGAVGFAEVNVP